MSYKKMGITILCMSICVLILIGAVTFVVDPYFHYRKPFDFQSYSLQNQRYQNDGIARNFDYNAIITGTSMTENFLASEFDELFSAQSIKIPYAGASFKEIDDAVERALNANSDVKIVLRSVDHYKLFEDKDYMSYTDYPEYLYDNNLFNDVSYIFNKDILLKETYPSILMTLRHAPSTTFDEYSNWDNGSEYGRDITLGSYERKQHSDSIKTFTQADQEVVSGTVYQNFIETAKNNPNTEFYYFLPPYSIVHWDSLYVDGEIERHLEAQKLAISMMLEYDNIHVYSFLTDYDTVCNLDNYKDILHYSGAINSKMLVHISRGEYEVTADNCDAYFKEVYNYYTSYDYESIFD